MRPRTLTCLAAVGLAVAVPAASAFPNEPMAGNAVLGTASKTCKVKRAVVCNGIKAVGANLAGSNLRGAHFDKANLSGASFRSADLRGATFRGAKLSGADFTGAILTGANFGPPTRSRKRANQTQPAPPCGQYQPA